MVGYEDIYKMNIILGLILLAFASIGLISTIAFILLFYYDYYKPKKEALSV